MIGFFARRWHLNTPGARLDALLVGVIVAALGAIIKSLLVHGWGDDETASGVALHPVWTLVGGAIVIVIGVAVLLLRWRRDQEKP